MYTDYHAEAYFLSDYAALQTRGENGGANAPIATPVLAEPTHMVLAMHAHPGSGYNASSQTPNPETPAK